MNSRFQGSVCLATGLLGLGCFLFLGEPQTNPGFATPSSSSVLVPLAEDSWQTTYWGHSTEQRPSSSDRYSWTITVNGLPRNTHGQRTIIVNCVGQPISTDDWGVNRDNELLGSFIFQEEATGQIKQLAGSSDFSTLIYPIELLLMKRPEEFELPGPYCKASANLPGNPTFTKIFCSRENGTVTYGIDARRTALKLCGGDRRVQMVFSSKHDQPQTLSSSASVREEASDMRVTMNLSWGHSAKLPANRAKAIAADIAVCQQHLQNIHESCCQASLGSLSYSPSDNVTLCDELTAIRMNLLPNLDDAVTKMCISQFTKDPGFSLHRVQLAWEILIDHRKKTTAIPWESVTLEGTSKTSSETLGKVTVLGFVYAGPGPAIQTVETLERIQQKFAADQVEVLVFATDLETKAKERVRLAFEDKMTVLEGAQPANALQLYRCGIPAIVVQCPDGKIHAIHAYQNVSTEFLLFDQIEQLLQSKAPGKASEKVTSSDQIDGASLSS